MSSQMVTLKLILLSIVVFDSNIICVLEIDDTSQNNDKSVWTVPSILDKRIEIVAVTGSLQLAQIKLGLTSCTKIGQCENIVIETFQQLPFQVDGEPWVQKPCVIKLCPSTTGQVAMLKRQTGDIKDAQDVADVLNWAERTKVINNVQKITILNELTRRKEKI